MKRFQYLCASAVLSLMLSGCSSPHGQPQGDSEAMAPSQVSDFATLYSQNCAGCHGATGMGQPGVFPPLAGHLLMVGEETGRLDQMFARMAEIYETDTRSAIKRFTALFEPLVILVMGIMVGALILSMLLAITSISDVAV